MTYKPDFYLGVVTGFKEGTEKEEHIFTVFLRVFLKIVRIILA